MANELENTFVAKHISHMYLHSEFADVNFVFSNDDQDVKVPAHKSILAMASPVFAAMFFGPMKENDIVDIVDASSSAFKEFLQFFYRPTVTLTMENIDAVARLADKYDMLDCVNACASFLESNLSKDSMFWGYQLAVALKNEPLQKFCEQNIQTYNSDTFQSDQFLRCDKTIVEHILKMETLFCDEFDLFRACIEWARATCRVNGLNENNPKTVRDQLGESFHLIRFGSMNTEDVREILSNQLHQGLFAPEEFVEIIRTTLDGKYIPKQFEHVSRSLPTFKWNDDKVLEFSLAASTNGRHIYVNRQESVWFSSSESLLLGRIELPTLYTPSSYPSSTITIVEYSDKMFGNNGPSKELGKFTASVSLSLAQPIIINLKKLYEIRWETTSNTDNIYHKCVWKKEVKWDQNTILKFYHNSHNSGIVYALRVNRINN